MMGAKAGAQSQLFYQFSLDEVVPVDHMLRKIDAVLDLTDVRAQLAPFYSHTGRPSIDPELMMRMLLIGYCYGTRSERRLCEEVRLNLAYRWFCRLGLEDAIPDHSAFSRARHGRFRDADILRKVFESTVETCMAKGLVGGEGFAADASIIRADANRQNHIEGGDDHDWTGGAGGSGPSRAVREYLKGLDREAAPPKEISLSDPASRLTAAVGRPAFFGWCTNYLIDVKHAVIMDVAATPALRTAEVNAAKAMIDRVENRFGMRPKRLIGDTAYGTAEMLAWMVDEKQIEPHVPVWDKRRARGRDLFALRLRVRRSVQQLHLSGWQEAHAISPQLRDRARRRRSGRPEALSREPSRLRRLRAQTTMLPWSAYAQGQPQRARGRARRRPRDQRQT